MDKLQGAFNSFSGGNNDQQQQGGSAEQQQKQGGGGFLGGLGDKFNSAAGGGRESEKNEDYLDKGTSISSYQCSQQPLGRSPSSPQIDIDTD